MPKLGSAGRSLCRGTHRLPFAPGAVYVLGTPARVSAPRDAQGAAEPRDVEPGVFSDRLEVWEGTERYSPEFLRTLSCTYASPSAVFSSEISARSSRSRCALRDAPPSRAVRPPSRNCLFQLPTDCSETFARRAASASVYWPERTPITTLSLSEAGITGGRGISSLSCAKVAENALSSVRRQAGNTEGSRGMSRPGEEMVSANGVRKAAYEAALRLPRRFPAAAPARRNPRFSVIFILPPWISRKASHFPA